MDGTSKAVRRLLPTRVWGPHSNTQSKGTSGHAHSPQTRPAWSGRGVCVRRTPLPAHGRQEPTLWPATGGGLDWPWLALSHTAVRHSEWWNLATPCCHRLPMHHRTIALCLTQKRQAHFAHYSHHPLLPKHNTVRGRAFAPRGRKPVSWPEVCRRTPRHIKEPQSDVDDGPAPSLLVQGRGPQPALSPCTRERTERRPGLRASSGAGGLLSRDCTHVHNSPLFASSDPVARHSRPEDRVGGALPRCSARGCGFGSPCPSVALRCHVCCALGWVVSIRLHPGDSGVGQLPLRFAICVAFRNNASSSHNTRGLLRSSLDGGWESLLWDATGGVWQSDAPSQNGSSSDGRWHGLRFGSQTNCPPRWRRRGLARTVGVLDRLPLVRPESISRHGIAGSSCMVHWIQARRRPGAGRRSHFQGVCQAWSWIQA